MDSRQLGGMAVLVCGSCRPGDLAAILEAAEEKTAQPYFALVFSVFFCGDVPTAVALGAGKENIYRTGLPESDFLYGGIRTGNSFGSDAGHRLFPGVYRESAFI